MQTWLSVHASLINLGQGRIIISHYVAAIQPPLFRQVWLESKAALLAFAKAWTSELRAKGIRVNVIAPGPIETGVFDHIPQEAKDRLVSMIPIGRIGQPEEIATTALFLASDDSSFISGSEIYVDGAMAQINSLKKSKSGAATSFCSAF
ncbi:MAG TPA: SDR family oxidoreductase [Mucilaginibacter sp.]|nr:SDR family oxidoreductase [Mucilaginibacter sp.]